MSDGIRISKIYGKVFSKKVRPFKQDKNKIFSAHGKWCIDSRNGCPVETPKKSECQYPDCFNKLPKNARVCRFGCERKICIMHGKKINKTGEVKCPDCVATIAA